MDENHQDTAGSKLIATEDIRWVLNKSSNLLVPKRKKNRRCKDRVLPPYDRVGLRLKTVKHAEGGSAAQKETLHKRDQMHFSSGTEELLELWDAFETICDPFTTHGYYLEWARTGSPLWIPVSKSRVQFT